MTLFENCGIHFKIIECPNYFFYFCQNDVCDIILGFMGYYSTQNICTTSIVKLLESKAYITCL